MDHTGQINHLSTLWLVCSRIPNSQNIQTKICDWLENAQLNRPRFSTPACKTLATSFRLLNPLFLENRKFKILSLWALLFDGNAEGGWRDVSEALLDCGPKRLHLKRATQLNVRELDTGFSVDFSSCPLADYMFVPAVFPSDRSSTHVQCPCSVDLGWSPASLCFASLPRVRLPKFKGWGASPGYDLPLGDATDIRYQELTNCDLQMVRL